MPKDVTRVSSLSAEIAAYTATFTALGLSLVGEFLSNGLYQVHATKAGALFGTPQAAAIPKDAVNALVAVLGIKPSSNHPFF